MTLKIGMRLIDSRARQTGEVKCRSFVRLDCRVSEYLRNDVVWWINKQLLKNSKDDLNVKKSRKTEIDKLKSVYIF